MRYRIGIKSMNKICKTVYLFQILARAIETVRIFSDISDFVTAFPDKNKFNNYKNLYI